MKAWEIVGYTYQAELLCPDCTVRALPTGKGQQFDGWALASGARMDPHNNIAEIGYAFGYADENAYDSGDFPKVVFASDVDGDTCGNCGREL